MLYEARFNRRGLRESLSVDSRENRISSPSIAAIRIECAPLRIFGKHVNLVVRNLHREVLAIEVIDAPCPSKPSKRIFQPSVLAKLR